MPILGPAECRQVATYLRRSDLPRPEAWEKGRAVRERFLYELATRPAILDRILEILGGDVVLWGVSAVWKRPDELHPWHSDIESSSLEGGFASVWLGIESTSRDSSLQLIPGSHDFGETLQEARSRDRIPREEGTADVALRLARERDAEAQLLVPDMTDGEAIFFDGRLWHGTVNRTDGERIALVCQFAAADRRIRIPDWEALDWPFRFLDEPEPPVIVVHGAGRGSRNRLSPPPPHAPDERAGVRSVTQTFAFPTDAERIQPWQPFPAFHGRTPVCESMSCHASVLAAGHSPHGPHAHDDEELLVPLHGEVELVIPSSADDAAPRRERLRPGAFVYYPAGQHHTIRNPGGAPVAYLMFKWQASGRRGTGALGTEIVDFSDVSPPDDAGDLWTDVLLDDSTGWLAKLHVHVSVLDPGAGYEPHRDAHDVAIVTLEGTLETLGRTVPPTSVLYHAAGEQHGLRNVGGEPARYLVFEFHGRPRPRARAMLDRFRRRA